ncbi:MAG: hypothetical protein WKF91_00710 [Segetibacter sp.]
MKTIVWDVDDVLNNLMGDWFEEWCSFNRHCTLDYNNIISNPPHELLKISLEEYKSSLDDFRIKKLGDLEPVPEILTWFQLNGNKYCHIALTAVPIATSHISAGWVFKNFGTWIRSFNIIPSPRNTDIPVQYHQTKKEFLGWVNKGDILIDDNIFNIEGANELGMKTLLFPRPWNNPTYTISQALQNLTELI